MKNRKWMLGVILITLQLTSVSALATPYVFGDSMSDAGNVLNATLADPTLIPDPIVPPFFQGRMTNGMNWADYVANDIGYGLLSASSSGGTNYAWSGATTAQGITIRSSMIHPGQYQPVDNVGKQISNFGTTHGSFASNDLVLYWSGGNDILHYAIGSRPAVHDAVSEMIALTYNNLITLNALGATRIVLPNQINAAIAPAWSGAYGLPAALQPYVSALTMAFNAQLPGLIDLLENTPGFDADIIGVDIYSLAAQVFADPAAYGYTDITNPAFPIFMSHADEHLFWDVVHPTTGFHRLIANEVMAELVPEPSVLLLLAAGLSVAGIPRKRRSR